MKTNKSKYLATAAVLAGVATMTLHGAETSVAPAPPPPSLPGAAGWPNTNGAYAGSVPALRPLPAENPGGASPSAPPVSDAPDIWADGVGNGFKAGVQSVSLSLGAGQGVHIFGGKQCHELALASLSYGLMLGPVKGSDHWYRGNWEVRGELFGGSEFAPNEEWVVGLTPHLRYNFATGTRWVPYADVGAGVSATSVGPPDLSHTFEFNLQAATGVRWFFRNNLAFSVEARYLHMSCAGMHTPNLGLNNVGGMVGISWFY